MVHASVLRLMLIILLEVDTKRANFGDDRFKNVKKYIKVQLETSCYATQNPTFIKQNFIHSTLGHIYKR